MKYLITGGCGFLGSNVASKLLSLNEDLVIFDNLSRRGSLENLLWLQRQGQFNYISGDIRIQNDIEKVIFEEKPDVIFHLAGQVAMTTSIAQPLLDFQINALGTMNILESIRKFSPDSIIIYSSSNKVYGNLEYLNYGETESRFTLSDYPAGLPESLGLNFESPYGCSKGSADQYVLDYSRIYGIKSVVFRHSSMYGGRQFPTFDQGWISWFCQKAIETLKIPATTFTISGTGKQVRDLLHAEDMVDLYLMAPKYISDINGQAFNIGGGFENSLSIIELLNHLELTLKISLNFKKIEQRVSDQKIFIADVAKIRSIIGWSPKISKTEGIRKNLEWVKSEINRVEN